MKRHRALSPLCLILAACLAPPGCAAKGGGFLGTDDLEGVSSQGLATATAWGTRPDGWAVMRATPLAGAELSRATGVSQPASAGWYVSSIPALFDVSTLRHMSIGYYDGSSWPHHTAIQGGSSTPSGQGDLATNPNQIFYPVTRGPAAVVAGFDPARWHYEMTDDLKQIARSYGRNQVPYRAMPHGATGTPFDGNSNTYLTCVLRALGVTTPIPPNHPGVEVAERAPDGEILIYNMPGVWPHTIHFERLPEPFDDRSPIVGPRVDYARTYVLLNGEQTSAPEAERVIGATWNAHHWTIGFSADDAGFGALTDRTVIAHAPGEWGDARDLRAFFEVYYPGAHYVADSNVADGASTSGRERLGSAGAYELGRARTDYARTYVLLRAQNHDATWAQSAMRASYAMGQRFTIGVSADDAGIGRGELTHRRVIVVQPDAWYDAAARRSIGDFFQTYYPGTQLYYLYSNSPAQLENDLRALVASF